MTNEGMVSDFGIRDSFVIGTSAFVVCQIYRPILARSVSRALIQGAMKWPESW